MDDGAGLEDSSSVNFGDTELDTSREDEPVALGLFNELLDSMEKLRRLP